MQYPNKELIITVTLCLYSYVEFTVARFITLWLFFLTMCSMAEDKSAIVPAPVLKTVFTVEDKACQVYYIFMCVPVWKQRHSLFLLKVTIESFCIDHHDYNSNQYQAASCNNRNYHCCNIPFRGTLFSRACRCTVLGG